jgi:hypothetical protein
MIQKAVHLNGAQVGAARTWHEVAALLTRLLGHTVTAREAQNFGSEGPKDFYVAIANVFPPRSRDPSP